MSQRRPSYVSIRVRQRNIIEAQETAKLSSSEMAKRLGVTKKELLRFKTSRPEALHRNFGRSASYRELFNAGKRSELRSTLKVARIKRYEYMPDMLDTLQYLPGLSKEERARRYQVGRQIQRVMYPPRVWQMIDERAPRIIAAMEWASFTSEQGFETTSIEEIKNLYLDGSISTAKYLEVLAKWKAIYNIATSNPYYQRVLQAGIAIGQSPREMPTQLELWNE